MYSDTLRKVAMQGGHYDPYQMFPGYAQPAATHYSIDVECVATGTDHNSRSVAQFALVVSSAAELQARLVLVYTLFEVVCVGPI